MKGPAWYKRYPGDFLNGVHGIGPDTIGCYAVVLDMIYDRGGPVPDDPRMIGVRLGCSTRLARALVGRLLKLEKLFLTPSGLSNIRAETELAKLRHNQDSAQKNGSKGGRVSAERVQKPFDYNGTAEIPLKPASSIARGLPDKIENILPVQSSTPVEKESGSAEKQGAVADPNAGLAPSPELLQTRIMRKHRAGTVQ